MDWQQIVFYIAIGTFVCSLLLWIVFSVKPPREKNRVRPFYWFFWGFFLSSIFLLVPVYHYRYSMPGEDRIITDGLVWRAILPSVHHAIQMLQANADTGITRYCAEVFKGDPALGNAYYYFLSAEYVLAPILTAGVILSFFKSVFDYVRYYTEVFFKGLLSLPSEKKLKGRVKVYVFSVLNEKSLALAESIRKNHGRAGILIFTDVSRTIEDSSSELVAKAKKLRAICFRKDIQSINFFYQKHLSQKSFFVIGDNETDNVNCAYELYRKYHALKDSRLYVFTMREECEHLIKQRDGSGMKVRRIHVISSLIFHNLYREGYARLFESAGPEKNGTRKIGVVIAGLGHYGMEMLKALTWYCQMEGYSLSIDAFDKDPLAGQRLKAECPDLMKGTDRKPEEGETPCTITAHNPEEDGTSCTITVHSGTDVHTCPFFDALRSLKETTYVLVSLGSDEENIRTAIDIRTAFAQAGVTEKDTDQPVPVIQAIVYTAYDVSRLDDLANYRKERYDIDFFGNVDSIFTEETVINSGLESEASDLHGVYFDKETFYQYEYYYRSSCAGVIHACAIADELYRQRVEAKWLAWADSFLKSAISQGKEDITTAIHEQLTGFTWKNWQDRKLIKDASWPPSSLKELIKKANGLPEGSEDPEKPLYYLILVEKLKELEHKRWNVYMRSEGYVYGKKRFDLGKMHHDLKAYSDLEALERNKDIRAGTIIAQINSITDHVRDTAAELLSKKVKPGSLEWADTFLDLIRRFPVNAAAAEGAENGPAAQLSEWVQDVRSGIVKKIRNRLNGFSWDSCGKEEKSFFLELADCWKKLIPKQNTGISGQITAESLNQIRDVMNDPRKNGFADAADVMRYLLLDEWLMEQEDGKRIRVQRIIEQMKEIKSEEAAKAAGQG